MLSENKQVFHVKSYQSNFLQVLLCLCSPAHSQQDDQENMRESGQDDSGCSCVAFSSMVPRATSPVSCSFCLTYQRDMSTHLGPQSSPQLSTAALASHLVAMQQTLHPSRVSESIQPCGTVLHTQSTEKVYGYRQAKWLLRVSLHSVDLRSILCFKLANVLAPLSQNDSISAGSRQGFYMFAMCITFIQYGSQQT